MDEVVQVLYFAVRRMREGVLLSDQYTEPLSMTIARVALDPVRVMKPKLKSEIEYFRIAVPSSW